MPGLEAAASPIIGGMRPGKADLTAGLWGIGITALLLIPLPTEAAAARWPALVQELTDFCHPVAFACLTQVLLRSLRAHAQTLSAKHYLSVAAGIILYAAATELLQAVVERHPSVSDFRNDLLGAAVAMLLHWRRDAAAAWARTCLASAAVVLGAVATQPLAWTLAAYAHRTLRTPVLWKADSRLFGRFSTWEHGRQPALTVHEPVRDWRGWNHLEVQIENPQPVEQPVVLRIHDLHHDQRYRDRYNERFVLAPGSRATLRIPLERIRSAPQGRDLDMAAIRGIIVFSGTRQPAAEFRVHEIRLAP